MTTSGVSTAGNTQSIVVEYELPKPPEAVWRALTEAKLLAAWLMENDFAPVVGHRFTFRAQPAPGWDGVVHCEVLEVVPHARLSYSWQGGTDKPEGGYGGSRLDTVVTWTLTRTEGNGTKLRLEHAGFTPANAFAYENMGKGWRGKLAERIAAVLARDE